VQTQRLFRTKREESWNGKGHRDELVSSPDSGDRKPRKGMTVYRTEDVNRSIGR
jgi:hypothetical protein